MPGNNVTKESLFEVKVCVWVKRLLTDSSLGVAHMGTSPFRIVLGSMLTQYVAFHEKISE